MGSHQFPCSIAGHQLITESFAQDRPFTKISAGASPSRSILFKMKKLLEYCLYLMWWPMGRKKRREQTERRIYSADSSFCRRTCQYWCLQRAFETACGPLGPERRSLMENIPFSGFSAFLCLQNRPAAVGEMLVSSRLAAILAGLKFGGLLNLQRFAAKRPGYASC